jgi:hypothetical protein
MFSILLNIWLIDRVNPQELEIVGVAYFDETGHLLSLLLGGKENMHHCRQFVNSGDEGILEKGIIGFYGVKD